MGVLRVLSEIVLVVLVREDAGDWVEGGRCEGLERLGLGQLWVGFSIFEVLLLLLLVVLLFLVDFLLVLFMGFKKLGEGDGFEVLDSFVFFILVGDLGDFGEPLDELSAFELAGFDGSFLVFEEADSVLLSLIPVAVEFSGIRPFESSSSVLLVIEVVAIIEGSVGPEGFSFSVHLVIFELSFIGSSVSPSEVSLSFNFVEDKGSFVAGSIVVDQSTFSKSLSLEELSQIAVSV